MPNARRKKARIYAGLSVFRAFQCLALPDAKSFPLDCARAFYPFVFHRINDFKKKIHHQNYHQDVVAYQFQTLPDSARKIAF
jgi:hypothetical protein